MNYLLVSLLGILLLFQCGNEDKNEENEHSEQSTTLEFPSDYNSVVTLQNEMTYVDSLYNLSMKLGAVSDSRCPKDMTCVWEGNAAVTLLLFKPTAHEIVLNTHRTFTQDTVIDNLNYRLASVTPFPGYEGERIVSISISSSDSADTQSQ